jgi:hypothetical protein
MAVSVESTKWDSNMIIKVVQKRKIKKKLIIIIIIIVIEEYIFMRRICKSMVRFVGSTHFIT